MYSFLKNVYTKILKKIWPNHLLSSAAISKISFRSLDNCSSLIVSSSEDLADLSVLVIVEKESITTFPFSIPSKSSDCLRFGLTDFSKKSKGYSTV